MKTYCTAQKLDSVLCGDLNGKEIQKRGDMSVDIADSLCCTAETDMTLQSNYTSMLLLLLSRFSHVRLCATP